MSVVTEQPTASKEVVNSEESTVATTAGGTTQPNSINLGEVALPTSLKLLVSASEVTVKQHIDPVEVVLCCFNRPCRYSVYIDGSENQLLYVQEVSDCYARQIMGAARGFALKFSDDDMMDIIRVVRPQTCSRGSCAICCTLPTLDVQTPPGISVSTITERRTCCLPTYDITSADGELLYSLTLVCYTCKSMLCCDTQIDICDTYGQKVAELVKAANFGECIGQTNNFTVKYIKDVTVTEKVSILGAVFLVDFHHFERQNRCCC